MAESLTVQAQDLADSLTQMLNSSVCDNAELLVLELPDNRFFLGHQVTGGNIDGELIPVTEHPKHLFLRVNWRFGPNSTGEFLRTDWSQFGLFVWSPKTVPHPLIRLEVDAETDRDAWNVAHIQVHATSQLLGQVWGLQKIDRPRPLEALHIPVGGFQYDRALKTSSSF